MICGGPVQTQDLHENVARMYTMLALVLISGMTGSFILAAVILFLFIRKRQRDAEKPAVVVPSTSSTSSSAAVVINDGDIRKVSRNGTYLAFDFDASRAKGKMCNAAEASQKDGAASFKFSKDGSSGEWIVATDCDGDGKYTSYLTRGTDLIEAKLKDELDKQRWIVECGTSGCSFKSKKDSKFLAGTFKKPMFTTNAAWFKIE